MIEPSDSERAGWPDATRAYVEALEADRDAALRSSVGYRNAYDGAADSCRAFKVQRDAARSLCRDLYEYALEIRSPDCAITDPTAWLAELRGRMKDLGILDRPEEGRFSSRTAADPS